MKSFVDKVLEMWFGPSADRDQLADPPATEPGLVLVAILPPGWSLLEISQIGVHADGPDLIWEDGRGHAWVQFRRQPGAQGWAARHYYQCEN